MAKPKSKPRSKRREGLGPKWKSRVVGRGDVDPRKLKDHPLNWRLHPETQQRVMRDAIESVGVIADIIVNKTTGHILDGHARKQLAIANEEETVGVLYVELTEDEERLALAMYNPLAELAATDPEKLNELLGLVDRQGGPLDDLLAELEEKASVAVVKETNAGKTTPRGASFAKVHVMRMMLANPDVMLVERSLAMTGKANRGEALLDICRSYMGKDDGDAAGQLDAGAESSLEDQLAKALIPAAGGDGDARRERPRVRKSVSDGAAGDRVRDGSSEGGAPDAAAADVERVPG